MAPVVVERLNHVFRFERVIGLRELCVRILVESDPGGHV
jgi:hypothetical protein